MNTLHRLLAALAIASASALPAGAQAVVPDDVTQADVAQLLRSRDYAESLQLTSQRLERSDVELAQTLYLHGAAQLGLADRESNRSRFLDAGLSFMRVVVYFPRSRYVGPALVELGRVHERIGRADLAAKLYERAGAAVDAQADPLVHARLTELRQRLTQSSNNPHGSRP